MIQKSKALRHAEADTIIAKVLPIYRVEIILTINEACWQRIFVSANNKKVARIVAKPTIEMFRARYCFGRIRVEIEKVK